MKSSKFEKTMKFRRSDTDQYAGTTRIFTEGRLYKILQTYFQNYSVQGNDGGSWLIPRSQFK